MTQIFDQVRIRLISKLFKGTSIVPSKLLKYSNGAATSAFIIPSLLVLPKNLDLNLNDTELVMEFFGQLYNIAINFQGFLNHFHDILLNYTSTLPHQDLLHYLLVCYLFHLYSW